MAHVYWCNLCIGFLAVSLRLLLNHLGRNHKSDPNFHLLCGVNGCARTYKRYYSFRNHIVQKHADLLDKECTDINRDANIEGAATDIHDQELECDANHDIHGNIGCEAFDLTQGKNDLLRSSAICLLHFKDKGRIPQTVVDLFVESNKHVVQNSIGVLKYEIKDNFNAAGIDFDSIPGLGELFDEESIAMNPFQNIEKEPQQYKYYKDNIGLVVSYTPSIFIYLQKPYTK